ncbi:MAG: abortive infection bacteriophage resistance protein [Candidatus Paceibacteria bacterium]|jgi:abortive infection bacteriophage resistance protein
MWVLIQKLSLGTTNKILKNLIKNDRELIIKNLNEQSDIDEPSERKIIFNIALLTDFRNLAAHNERVYNFTKRKMGNSNFSTLVQIFEKMLSREQFDEFLLKFKNEFSTLKENLNRESLNIIRAEMGLHKK